MDFFACVVGAKSASWRSGVCDAIRPMLLRAFFPQFTHIAIRPCGRANYNSPLRVCYPNVGKYHVNV